MNCDVKRLILKTAMFLSFIWSFMSIPSALAACPVGPVVSCNASNFELRNYVDVVVTRTSEVKMFTSVGFPAKVVIKQGGTVLRTINQRSATQIEAWDTRTVNVTGSSVTLRYEFYISDQPFYGWMPSNTGNYRGHCGTGCQCPDEQGNFAVVDNSNVYNRAVQLSNGGVAYDLSAGGVTLFNASQRTQAIDKAMSCWNDNPGGSGQSLDFNDLVVVWTLKAAAQPSASPSPSPSPSHSPSPSPSPSISHSPSPSVSGSVTPSASLSISASPRTSMTHTPSDTGFADGFLVYMGAVMYAVGIIFFMGAKAFMPNGKGIKLRIIL